MVEKTEAGRRTEGEQRVNLLKVLSPDFFPGKALLTLKAAVELLLLLIGRPTRRSLRVARLLMKVIPRYTMVSVTRLSKLYQLVQEANAQGIPGDLVECGVWNGGSSAVMARASQDAVHPVRRRLWLFDSFQGLPPPGDKDGRLEQDSYFQGWNKGDTGKVREVMDRLGIPTEDLSIVPGWFQDTLDAPGLDRIALLHVDADWYDSVKLVLDKLYDRVAPGGFIVLDDYGLWKGCRKALDDFLRERRLEGIPLTHVGRRAVYFEKPRSAEEGAHAAEAIRQRT